MIIIEEKVEMDIWALKTLEDALCLSKFYILTIENISNKFSTYIDEQFSNLKPSYLILGSALVFYSLNILIHYATNTYKSLSYGNIISQARKLPIIRGIVERKVNDIGKDMKKELVHMFRGEEFVSCLPKKALSAELLLKKVKHYQGFDTTNWQQGRISGAIYTNNSTRFNEILLSVYGSNMWSNPLHSDVFASIRKMEGEIVRMVTTMYKGDVNKVVGSVTSGGTESIVMACKAYRDYVVKTRGIDKGQAEIIAPVTAHAAFEKAANILCCKMIHIPVDKKTYKVDVRAMKRAITSNTCMLVTSAPHFPHGIIDPIEIIARIGLARNIPVHVDACLGGFLIPFMKEAGHELDEKFDFTVPGVTSISADTHKYGYAPKGTSVILYSDRKYIHQQYSVQTDWPGGIYASPTLPGSRPGALIATCWAAMMFHGQDGYIKATDKIIKTTKYIKQELSGVEGLQILGNPQVSVLAFSSDRFNIYSLNDRLKNIGWNLNALQFPSAFHLCVTLMHTDGNISSSFVRDVKAITKDLLTEPRGKVDGSAAIYGMAQTIPDRSVVTEICTQYLDGCLGY